MARITNPSLDPFELGDDVSGVVATVLRKTWNAYEYIDTIGARIRLEGDFNDHDPFRGFVERVRIDQDNDGIYELLVDYEGGIVPASVLFADFARGMLSGEDTFDISNPSGAPVSGGRVYQGDGYRLASGTTWTGADDTFLIGADTGRVETIGDFARMEGTLTGGADTFTFVPGASLVRVVGDASITYTGSSLIGGNDVFAFSGTSDYAPVNDDFGTHQFWGDAASARGDVDGGNDRADFRGSLNFATLSGDVGTFEGTSFVGGDDTLIAGDGSSHLYGDAVTVNMTSGRFEGGRDLLVGGASRDLIYGDHGTNMGAGTVIGGDDVLRGGRGDDFLYGQGGSDQLYGNRGDDYLAPGTGFANLVDGGAGVDTVSFADTLANFNGIGTGVDLALSAGGAFAVATYGDGERATIENVENVLGTDFNDTITGNEFANRIRGGAGSDRLDGAGGRDLLDYYEYREPTRANQGVIVDLASGIWQETYYGGVDRIANFEDVRGTAYNDRIFGTSGANTFFYDRGVDTFDARGGVDTLDLSGLRTGRSFGDPVTVDLALEGERQNLTSLGRDAITLFGFENVVAATGSGSYFGTDGANVMTGGAWDETFQGRGGVDTFHGGAGFDTIDYSDLATRLVVDLRGGTARFDGITEIATDFEAVGSSEGRTVVYGDFDDETVHDRGTSDDTFQGRGGTDTYSYAAAANGVTVYLEYTGRETGAGLDTLVDVENLIGSGHDDRLVGDDGDNTILGRGGDDLIKLRDGENEARGGGGDDRIVGGEGRDVLYGHGDFTDFDIEFGWKGGTSDVLIGLGGDDELRLQDTGFAYGGRGDDTLHAGDEGSKLRGNRGDDTLYGDAGDDDLRGGGGNDVLYANWRSDDGKEANYLLGGRGADILYDSPQGDDVLVGGQGGGVGDGFSDTFVFRYAQGSVGTRDRIKDFEDGIDKIDLSATGAGFDDLAELLTWTTAYDGAIGIQLGGDRLLVVENFTIDQLTADDVLL